MDYRKEYMSWLEQPTITEAERAELAAIADDEKQQEDRFYTELEFGTAGLRGVLGMGTNRMNDYVVRRATAGLAAYLLRIPGAKDKGVAIAYDSRRCSDRFAEVSARTLAAYGVKSFLYSTLHSVPQLSFTVRELGCEAGVVITASHNPPEYNGYKVYWSHGGQCGPAQADEILASIRDFGYFDTQIMDFDEAKEKGLITMIGEEVDEIYYKKTMSVMLNPELVREEAPKMKGSLVYSPLHGSGRVPVTTILGRIGINNLYVVKEQEEPNGDFPTVKAPNPEDPNAFVLAMELGRKVDAGLLFATDPDSDRLGVAVRLANGDYRVLTGNQIGSILIYYILSELKAQGRLPEDGFVVKSLVSTALADVICRSFGVEIRHVLTGFRFIAEQIDLAEQSGRGRFLFGFEESYGFLSGGFAHDKDAVLAAMLVCEAAIVYASRGKGLIDVLNEIYEKYGYFIEKTKSYTLKGKEGIERIAHAMAALRETPPTAFGEAEPILIREDFKINEKVDCASGSVGEIGLPASNVLRYTLGNDAWVVVRPSGTEPKLKLYVGAAAESEQAANERMERIMTEGDKIVSALLNG
ncbi:MAG: phospho-sugar mutase [Clostridia bacterium]|nr:phospho-sugar mutase [Clostridia bacterium]MBQ5489081.1 phospho-sugar mutase [Clostridia bacterium]